MTEFEALPGNIQALMLAKLALALKASRCVSLHELAKSRNTDLTAAWRSVCRMARQPVCTIPIEVARPHG
jgi:hypothetical protein